MRLCHGLGPRDLPSEAVSGSSLEFWACSDHPHLARAPLTGTSSTLARSCVPFQGPHVQVCVHLPVYAVPCPQVPPFPSPAPSALVPLFLCFFPLGLGPAGSQKVFTCLSASTLPGVWHGGSLNDRPRCVGARGGADRPEREPLRPQSQLVSGCQSGWKALSGCRHEYHFLIKPYIEFLLPHRHVPCCPVSVGEPSWGAALSPPE